MSVLQGAAESGAPEPSIWANGSNHKLLPQSAQSCHSEAGLSRFGDLKLTGDAWYCACRSGPSLTAGTAGRGSVACGDHQRIQSDIRIIS